MIEEPEMFLGMEVGGWLHMVFVAFIIVSVIGTASYIVYLDEKRKDHIPVVTSLFSTKEGCTAYKHYDRQRQTYQYFMACKTTGYVLKELK